MIYNFALEEYEKPETSAWDNSGSSKYDEDTNYTRSGYTTKKTMSVALLRTCGQIYLETWHLPAIKKAKPGHVPLSLMNIKSNIQDHQKALLVSLANSISSPQSTYYG